VRLREVGALLLESVKGWSKDNVPRLGASLAYYTLFSVAPMLVIVVALAGSAFGEEAVRGEIVRQVDDLIGVDGGRALQGRGRRVASLLPPRSRRGHPERDRPSFVWSRERPDGLLYFGKPSFEIPGTIFSALPK
jgi:hypothetical protein